MQSKIFSDFNKFSPWEADVDEGVVGVRATVAATSAVVAAVVSMSLFHVFDKSRPGQKAILLPVLWTWLLLSTTVRISCEVSSLSSVNLKQIIPYKRTPQLNNNIKIINGS